MSIQEHRQRLRQLLADPPPGGLRRLAFLLLSGRFGWRDRLAFGLELAPILLVRLWRCTLLCLTTPFRPR